MSKYSIWWQDVWYGEFEAENEWEACLMAANGDEVEAETLNWMITE